jgi:hypothetical protein
MNSDLDDSDNDVPPVTPGDDWEDLDDASEKAKPDLSPRKPDRGLPPKKEHRRPLVNQYAPKLKLEENEAYSPIAPRKWSEDQDDQNDLEDSDTPGRSEKADDGASGGAGEEYAAATGGPAEERVVLPPSTADRRFRVNEITPSSDAGMKHRTRAMAPKVAKSVLEEKPRKAGELRRRFVRGERGDWGKKTGKGSLVWMGVTGVGVIALVVAAVVLSQRISKKSRGGEESIYSKLVPIAEEVSGSAEDLEILEMLTNSQDEAKGIFARYATAKTPADFLDSVHRAEDNGEAIELRWEPLGMKAGWTPGDGAAWTILERDGMRYGVLEGTLSDFTRFSAYFRRDGDALKMDWKATSGYGTADFDELKKSEGDGSEIRARISYADFYTFALPEGSFRSFRLMSPDGQANLWGYTRVGGELDGKLLALFVPSQITGEMQNDAAVVLGLQPGPDESLPNQWMIRKLVRLNWLDE